MPSAAGAGNGDDSGGSPDPGVVDRVLARASVREQVFPEDARSGAIYERVIADRQPFFVKRYSRSSDWNMRLSGDTTHRAYRVWSAGVMGAAERFVDHTVVGMKLSDDSADRELTVLMRDVGPYLVPPGDTAVGADQHAAFVRQMARLAAAFWGWTDHLDLTRMDQRVRMSSPEVVAVELDEPSAPAVVTAMRDGWTKLSRRRPEMYRLLRHVHHHPGSLLAHLDGTPTTFLQGDWKMGNLGLDPAGRVILLDWAYPGAGPPAWDMCWYLALNRARLPESKERSLLRFRADIESAGLATSAWWDRQLAVCLVGVMATFGWEKALGDDEELSWWAGVTAGAAAELHLEPGASDEGQA